MATPRAARNRDRRGLASKPRVWLLWKTTPEGMASMRGTMMESPLLVPALLDRAARYFPDVEVVSRQPDKSLHRTTWRDVHRRSRALADSFAKLGLRKGDRVATLMWNHARHLETYFAVPLLGG